MPRARKNEDTAPASEVSAPAEPTPVDKDEAAGGKPATVPTDEPTATEGEAEPAGSEEVMVVLPAADEPVRHGGHVLTENGWVLEEALAAGEGELEDDQEQGE